MAKANYNKMEDALDKGLHHLKVRGLLKEADIAQGKLEKSENKELTPKQKMIIINYELKWMCKQDPTIYKTLKIKRKKVDDLLQLVSTPGIKLKNEEIEEIENLRINIENLKKSKFAAKPDAEQLQKEIDRHVYKRHNIKEKWIPMDTHSDWDKYKNAPLKKRRW